MKTIEMRAMRRRVGGMIPTWIGMGLGRVGETSLSFSISVRRGDVLRDTKRCAERTQCRDGKVASTEKGSSWPQIRAHGRGSEGLVTRAG